LDRRPNGHLDGDKTQSTKLETPLVATSSTFRRAVSEQVAVGRNRCSAAGAPVKAKPAAARGRSMTV